MNNDPYAAPTADLQTDSVVIETSTWSARGRLSRLSHLAHAFLLLIIAGLISTVAAFLFSTIVGGFEGMDLTNLEPSLFTSPMAIAGSLVLLLLFVIFLYLYVCMLIKRLHDRNHSGWWSLPLMVLSVIPVIGLITVIGYIYVMLFPGNKHSNRFGGQRETKGWEKILGILYIVLMVLMIVGGGASFFFAMNSL